MRDRTVWGELVPFGKVWRTGANKATAIRFSKDVKVAGQPLAAGTYSVFTIPDASNWTVIFNRNTEQFGTSRYDESQDALRVKATMTDAPARERMTFVFTDTQEGSTRLDLEWAGKRVSIPIEADTASQAQANIDKAVSRAWWPHADAADYQLEHGNVDAAKKLIEGSIAIKETWYNRWLSARILKAKNDRRGAKKAAKRALDLGDDSNGFKFYGPQIQKAVDTW